MGVTLKEVALRAGVSRSAVSRVFTDGASASADMRSKVEKAAAELGYTPNALASSLTTGRTRLVGLVSNNFHNPIFLEVFDLFTKGLQDRGLRPLLVNLSEETDPQDSVRMLQQYSVDGVVVASSTLPPSFSDAFRLASLPVVHSFGRPISTPSVPVVGIDNVECGRMAAREFAARGYREVAFMGGPRNASSTQDRLEGFLSETRLHSGISATYSFAQAYSFRSGRMEMQRLLGAPLAEAYFCGDDVLSIGALSALRESGRAVPDDIGILGLNDMEMAGWENISLTTIHQPIRLIVNASIELITGMLEDPDSCPQTRLFPCTIVERNTLRARCL
ncbi:MAG: LacI family DNA-binding transcriptional regulator [Granulosicoccus sp.]